MRRSFVIALAIAAPVAVWGQRPTVCIDPGHPSEVGKGCVGRKTSEIAVNWDLALRLRALLERDGLRVVSTKSSENQRMENRKRAEIANAAGAILTVRIHCDAGSGTGFAVYYPDRIGKVGRFEGPTDSVLRRSTVAAKAFHAEYARGVGTTFRDRGLFGDEKTEVGSRQGALTGSIFAKGPTVLIEVCVLTNRADEDRLLATGTRYRVARCLERATLAALDALGSNRPGARLHEGTKPPNSP